MLQPPPHDGPPSSSSHPTSNDAGGNVSITVAATGLRRRNDATDREDATNDVKRQTGVLSNDTRLECVWFHAARAEPNTRACSQFQP